MSNNEQKEIQKEKAKKKCIKILNIGSYILSLLFILLMILTGVQSCNKSATGTSAEEIVKVENLARTQWHFNDVIKDTDLQQYDQYEWQILFDVQSGTRFNYIFIDDYSISYRYNDQDAPYYAYTAQYGWDGISGQTITFYGDYYYLNYDNDDLITFLTNNATLVDPLTTFTFNQAFNYNAPLGLNVGITGLPFLNDLAWIDVSDVNPPSTKTETTATLLLLPFYANGRLYNAIQTHYQIARSSNPLYVEDKEGQIQQVKINLPLYDYQSYAYIDGSSVSYADVVNIRDTTQSTINNDPVNVYQVGTTWINDVYRYLNFSGYVISGDLSTRLKAFNNNNELVIYTADNDLASTFELLTGVFAVIAPILSIKVLPYISIGVIVFIPLIVAVIFFIIDKIKK